MTPGAAVGGQGRPRGVYSGSGRPGGRAAGWKGAFLRVSCRRLALALTVAVSLSGAAACAHHDGGLSLPAPGSMEEDQFLYTRGTELLKKKDWLRAREYFQKLIDTYPQSQYRNDARLGVGDSYLGENRTESDILAVNAYRQFLQFAPLNPRADYAQYKICVAERKQILNSQRDQTWSHEALDACDAFLQSYPTSQYRPEVQRLQRVVRDRLSDHEFEVGLTYFRLRLYPGAELRLRGVLTDDPGYSHLDQVYFYLAETLSKSKRTAEALPLYSRVPATSKLYKKAQKRIAEIKH